MSDHSSAESTDLSGTALYTAGVWSWYGIPGAHLLSSKEATSVFHGVNALVRMQHLEQRKSPSLRHSLVQRHQLITHLVEAAQPTCVVELASGFAPRGATVSARTNVDYIEIDRSAVLAKKRALLERSAEGQAVLDRDNFQMVAGDALDVDLVETVRDGSRVVVVFEGLMPYLDEFEQRKLFANLGAQAPQFDELRLVFDHVPWVEQPAPGPIGRTLGRWFDAATSGGFRRDERNRDDLVDELRQVGFATTHVHDPATTPVHWPVPRWRDRRTQMLIFESSAGRA